MFLLETKWNLQGTLQTIGRGQRRLSHAHLPVEQRVLRVYQMILVKPPVELRDPNDTFPYSADEMLEQLSTEKQKEIDPLLKRLKALPQ